jgi:hypothetical protein
MRRQWLGFLLLAIFGLTAARAAEPGPIEFHLTFDKTVSAAPFSGRVFVIVSKQAIKDLPPRPNWFNPEPFFAKDVKDWKPGETLVFKDNLIGYPGLLAKVAAREYHVQAVLDLDGGEQNPLASAGNGHSKPLRVDLDPAKSGAVKLHIDQRYPERKFSATERVKLVDIPSVLLTKFHGKPMRLRAGVVLPKSYTAQKDKRYPVIYEIPGFGGNHHMAASALARNATDVAGVEFLYVMLDPGCRLGHHVFADSANNGPCGQALISELIPYIEKVYRAEGKPAARFVTGHSSGGWSSLWLQVNYPDFFGGVWSTAPDPVDFRDFQRVNVYTIQNLFKADDGKPRPLGRKKDKILFTYQSFSDMENVMGRGGQLGSFEAVFSERGPDGRPLQLWDRASGAINHKVAKSWEKYDIRLLVEQNWKALEPRLKGKLHVYMGAEDNFYLEGATILLKEALTKLGSDAVVEIFPGRDHGTLVDADLRKRIAGEMAAQYRRGPGASNVP